MRKSAIIALGLVASLAAGVQRVGSVEHPDAIDGTTGQSIATNAFDGSGGSAITSYFRFFNGATAASTFSISIAGSQTGQLYGQPFTIQIPTHASPQYSLGQLLVLAGTAGAGVGVSKGDTSFALFITDPDASAGYQHVAYNGTTTLFENNSVCNNGLLSAAYLASTGQNVLTNVHTSRLAAYPSVIYFFNYSNASVTAPVQIYDAGLVGSDGKTLSTTSGTMVGSTSVTIPANATVTKNFTDLQTAVNWTPTATQLHANVVVAVPQTASTNPVILAHSIYNATLGGSINMTAACSINNPPAGGGNGGSSTGSTATTSYQGTIAGSDGTSGTLSVTVSATVASSTAPATTAAVEKPRATVQASGALLVSGTTTSLSGTYDSSANTINLSGGKYAFTGNVSSGVFSGTYTGPNNSTGGFSALTGTSSSVTAYCGTSSTGGVFNMLVSSTGALSGSASDPDGVVALSGQGASSSVSGSSYKNGSVNATFNGTIQNGKISGTYSGANGSGSFSGSACSLPSSSGSGGGGSDSGSGGGNSSVSLAVTVAGSGNGSVTSSPGSINCTGTPDAVCNGNFSAGTAVTLTPVTPSGANFAGWSGACSGTGACVVTITSTQQSVTATFSKPGTLFTTVASLGNGSGTVTSSPAGINCGAVSTPVCQYQFNGGTAVTLTASPGSDSSFGGWAPGCPGGQPTCTLNIGSGDMQGITATFYGPSFTLNFSGSFNGPSGKGAAGVVNIFFSPGAIAGGPCAVGVPGSCNWGNVPTNSQNGSLTYLAGTVVTLTPSPVDGTFVGWGGACTGTGTCTLTMNSNKTVTATFHGTCNPPPMGGGCTP